MSPEDESRAKLLAHYAELIAKAEQAAARYQRELSAAGTDTERSYFIGRIDQALELIEEISRKAAAIPPISD